MEFCDRAKILIKSGKGGDGCVSFHRAKFLEYGGPDGGNGGDGGDVVFITTNNMNSLATYKYAYIFEADNGKDGSGQGRTGASGQNLILQLPVGTQIFEDGIMIADLDMEKSKFVAAKGGVGGRGNLSFKSSTNRAPRQNTLGVDREEKRIELILKVIADVGIIGKPNVGKSSLLKYITNAKPKVGDYAFTTLHPNLGNMNNVILADIPGLIEGAHRGVGLGYNFLGHIERCIALIHVIDITSIDCVGDYMGIQEELRMYNPLLLNKKEIIVCNKSDLVDQETIKTKMSLLSYLHQDNIICISTITGKGIDDLKNRIIALRDNLK